MISRASRVPPFAQGVKKTAHSIDASREPKSDAKLQPRGKPTKYSGEKIHYLTYFCNSMAKNGQNLDYSW